MADYQCPHCERLVTAQPEDTRYALVCPSCNKFFRAEDARTGVDAPPVEAETPSVLTALPPDVVTARTGTTPTSPRSKAGFVTAQVGTIAAILAMVVMGLAGWAILGGGASRSSQAGTQQRKAASGKAPVDNPSACEPSRADKAAIRTWLKENLGDPQWEEIKWYPSVSKHEIARKELANAKATNDAYEIRIFEEVLGRPDARLCGLKLRAKLLFGVPMVESLVWKVSDGKATVPCEYDVMDYTRSYFADDR